MKRQDFITCVEKSQRNLRRFLCGLCSGNVDLADDIAQEAYMKAYLASENFNDLENFNAWVTKIAYNVFLNTTRSRRHILPLESADATASTLTADSAFSYEKLYAALDLLSDRDKTVILLYYMQGYSTKEISAILDITDETARQALSRGRKKLKLMIK